MPQVLKQWGLNPTSVRSSRVSLWEVTPGQRSWGTSLQSYKDLFLVAFFLSIGLSGLPDIKILVVSAVLLVFILFKGWLFFRLLSRFNFRARTALFSAVPLSNYSEFGLIVTAAAVKAGWIDSSWLILLAMALTLSFLAGAPLNASVYEIYNRSKDILKKYQLPGRHPDDQPIELDADILIVGMGRVGTGAYEEAKKVYGKRVIGIDSNPATVELHKKEGKRCLFGDVTDIDFWDWLKMKSVKLVSLCMPLHQSQLTAVSQLRRIGFNGLISATCRFPDEAKELKEKGVDSVYNIFENVGAAYAEYVTKDLRDRLPRPV